MIDSTQNPTNSQEISRTALIIGGIVTAILVSPFLMHDAGMQVSAPAFPQVDAFTRQVIHTSSMTFDVLRTFIAVVVN